ncbi:hypothetical protein INT44_009119 [Umbelopsis vinacea]|uniref:Pleckstrin homology domain-containing protein n=1 Tax=Umbelopsis vinacea TaxID=44442 RepID=A0A8H7UMD8_9FUNG|nr:hypothetical protein INT44_009119 [Umbelopsis vinacea]
MIDVPDSPKTPTTINSNENALQQLQDRISMRTRALDDAHSESNKSILQNQYKQLKEHYKLASDSADTTERESQNARETTEHKLYDLIRQKSELKAQCRKSEFSPKAYPPRMTCSNSTPVSGRITSICSPTDNFPLPTSCAIPASPSSPHRRRIKSPTPDDIHTDIDFATEIGQGLLLEVRKMHNMVQEKNETIKALDFAKTNDEVRISTLENRLKMKEDAEERLKDQCWDLEVSKQELIAQVTELQQKLARKTVDHTRVANRLNALTEESEALRNKNEQQSEAMKSMQKKINDSPPSRQNRSPLRDSHGHHSRSSLLPVPAKLDSIKSASITSITTSVAESEASDTPKQSKSSPTAQTISTATGKTVEVDALKHSLAHSHRTIAQLRAMLHMERTEKNETKKLLSESQETIEKMRRNRNAWTDEEQSVQLNTPKIKMVPSKRRGAARYASGLIRGSEVDHHCELEPVHAEENIRTMDESCDEADELQPHDEMQPHEDQHSLTLATSESQIIKPHQMRSLGEELQLATFSIEPMITDSPKSGEMGEGGKDQVQDSLTVSEGGQLKAQVAYHAKRTSPKRRNIDSSKECSLRRSPKVRDLTNNPASHGAGRNTEIPTPKPTMSESTVRTLQETIVMRPSFSEPRVPVLIQTHLPSTTNLGEISVKKDEENRKTLSSICTQTDANTKLDAIDTPTSQKRNSRLLRKSSESQRSASSVISIHWRSSISGDMASSRLDYSTGGLTLLTQTMIGDWMWKYTRKTVGNGYSEKPHKRFCWIHPYTRTLYWSTVEPGIGEAESRAKSAFIESVVTAIDEGDVLPRDMPRASIIIKTSSRELKLKARDDIKHTVWFEALKYLLLRTSPASTYDVPMLSSASNQRRSEVLSSTISQATLLRKQGGHGKIPNFTDKSEQPSLETNQAPFPSLSTLFHRSSPSDGAITAATTTTASKQQKTLSHRVSMRLRPLSTVSTSLSLRRRQSLAIAHNA